MDYTRKEAAAELLRGGAHPERPREQQLRQAVEHVRSTREWVEVASKPDNRDAYISEEMAKARAQNTLDGVLVAPEEAFAKLERVKRDKYDERVMQEARAVLELLPEVLGALEEEAQSFESLPPASMEPARRTLQLAERNELRLRFNDRPLAELLTLYIKSDDQRHRDLVEFIEDEHAAKWPTLKARMDKSDAAAITAFPVKIRERRAARRPAWVGDLIDQLTALNTPVKRSLLQELGHVGAHASTNVVKLASTKLAVEGQ